MSAFIILPKNLRKYANIAVEKNEKRLRTKI